MTFQVSFRIQNNEHFIIDANFGPMLIRTKHRGAKDTYILYIKRYLIIYDINTVINTYIKKHIDIIGNWEGKDQL